MVQTAAVDNLEDLSTGPRQAGKTTLAQSTFPGKPYVSLEDPDTRAFAEEDPRGFVVRFLGGAILDEAQRCPALFSYLQTRVDATRRMGEFVLTGSQQFGLLDEAATRSFKTSPNPVRWWCMPQC